MIVTCTLGQLILFPIGPGRYISGLLLVVMGIDVIILQIAVGTAYFPMIISPARNKDWDSFKNS